MFLKHGRPSRGRPTLISGYFYGKSVLSALRARSSCCSVQWLSHLNALSLALVLLCDTFRTHDRAGPRRFSPPFVMASVVRLILQMMPETFNFSLAALGYFCWLYKECVPRALAARRQVFNRKERPPAPSCLDLSRSQSDHAPLIAAPILWALFRRGEATRRMESPASAPSLASASPRPCASPSPVPVASPPPL